MSAGLAALLDDVAAMARLAAASVDDVAAGASRASVKAAGVIVDDAAVTPRYVQGVRPDRELPMIKRIAVGSLRNKLLLILPAALVLSELLPWLLTPILMIVALAIPAGVYGVVGLIVKMDDVGLRLAQTGRGPAASLGGGLVRAMP